jgi:D-alanyl-D-alanine endopeptidase (penicillin-binding protein 7)
MNNTNILKLLFLGVLLIVILIGNQNYKLKTNQANVSDNLTDFVSTNKNNSNLNNQINENNNLNNLNQTNLISTQNIFLNNENKDNYILKSEASLNPNLNQSKIFIFKNNSSTPSDVLARIVLVSDLKTGEVIWSKNQEKKWPIASLTKLVTSAYVFKNFNLKTKITLTEKDVNVLDSGTQSDQILKAGESYYVIDLIKWMMLASRNEAAEALANYFGRDNFILGMNNLVKDWGANSIYFVDPTGLSVSNQSTPEDILKIIQKIYSDYPEILNFSTKKSLNVRELESSSFKTINNINPFAGNPEFLGGKTGFISESKQNLISVFNFKKRPIMILVLGSEDRAKDTEIIFNWVKLNVNLVENNIQ